MRGNKIVEYSDVVGASSVGAAPTTSSFSTHHLASMDWAKTTTRRDARHLRLRLRACYYYHQRFGGRDCTPQVALHTYQTDRLTARLRFNGSISCKTSQNKISWSLEAARLVVWIIASLWNLRSYDKTSYRILKEGLGYLGCTHKMWIAAAHFWMRKNCTGEPVLVRLSLSDDVRPFASKRLFRNWQTKILAQYF